MPIPTVERAEEVTINSFLELERALKTGAGLPKSHHEEFTIPSLQRLVERRAFVQEGIVSVDLRQYVDPEHGKDVIADILVLHPSLWLGLTYSDGYEDLSKGGTFAVTPTGKFSNRFGPSGPCIEHGPMRVGSQVDLVCLALGKPATALAVAAPLG